MFEALCKNLKEEWKSGYGFFFLSDSAVSVKFKILKSQPTQEPTTYLLNNMCWYNNTLMNLVETALHCTIHITRHTYTTYKKFEKMGVVTRLRSNKNDLQDTPIKLKTFFNPVKIETLVLSPMSTYSVLKRVLNKNKRRV